MLAKQFWRGLERLEGVGDHGVERCFLWFWRVPGALFRLCESTSRRLQLIV